MRNFHMSRARAGLLIAASALVLSSCASEFTRTGSSPSFLIVDAMLASSGAQPEELGGSLASDVITLVEQQVNGANVLVPTVFQDNGRVRMRVAMRNPLSPTGPSAINAITLNRYRVTYRRTDGRNTPGVDVPHGFDGAIGVTVPEDEDVEFSFPLVRLQAKLEPPLINLRENGGRIVISTLAEVTFYGRDQAGNEVSASGSLSIDFSDWGDPR